jgi:hypothetical protein
VFVILGSPRSGTTLLSRVLDAHPGIVVPEETDFIIPTAFVCHRVPDETVGKPLLTSLIASSNAFKTRTRWFISEQEVAAAVEGAEYSTYGIVSAIYRRVAYNQWVGLAGDKSPNDLIHLPILLETGFFERDVAVIHLVRDVRDVVASLLRLDWREHDPAGTFARAWANANLYAYDRLHALGDRYRLVRYEDLVQRPAEIVEAACGMLGVEFRGEMLEPARRRELWGKQPHHEHIGEPIVTSRAGAWRADLDPEIRRRCERDARDALAHFGYLDGPGDAAV